MHVANVHGRLLRDHGPLTDHEHEVVQGNRSELVVIMHMSGIR